MLTYEYECDNCGTRFERRQAITEDPIRECPECGGAVRRLISGGAGFIFKGSGRDRPSQRERGCSLERLGRTCCGREERCDHPRCGDEP